MKIQCDVCDKDEASVFCVADEAALCAVCDHRVHHANKLAGKHQRFSLHQPSPKQIPLCDICQERRAFLFCQQDRAILCRECDISIHKANEHTQKHTRFLLTGVKLSANSSLYSTVHVPSSAAESASKVNSTKSDVVPKIKSKESRNKTVSVPATASTTLQQHTSGSGVPAPADSCDKANGQLTSGMNFNEYLIEMLPGWHVEDFLDCSSPSPYGFCKNGENDLLPFWDAGVDSNNMGAFSSEKMGFWVPQATPQPLNQTQINQSNNQSLNISFGATNELSKEFTTNNSFKSSSRKWSEDNSFAVPQISPPSNAFKRSRNLW